ncbi:TniB family NTP-binding protein [Streptomyces sp. NBC_01431]|nr:TniB family NTP-binding protein [Streptomyces sp. NBC_01431]
MRERLGYVRADRWIGYPRATEALEQLETLLVGRPSSGCRTCVGLLCHFGRARADAVLCSCV